jgi:MinD superfamily P-loop ATPase
MVCVNKADLNPDTARRIQTETEEKGYIFLGNVPFDKDFTKAMIQTRSIIEYNPDGEAADSVRTLWNKVLHNLA